MWGWGHLVPDREAAARRSLDHDSGKVDAADPALDDVLHEREHEVRKLVAVEVFRVHGIDASAVGKQTNQVDPQRVDCAGGGQY